MLRLRLREDLSMTTLNARVRYWLRAAVCLGVLACLQPATVAGQSRSSGGASWTPGRTPDGQPDLQGFWSNQSVTTLTRGANIPKLVLTPDEAAKSSERSQQRLQVVPRQ